MGWSPLTVALGTLVSESARLGAARPESPSSLGGWLATLGLVILSLTVLGMMRRKLRKASREDALTPRERIERIRTAAEHANSGGATAPRPGDAAHHARSREALESLMADSEELTRRLAAIMDNKAARLEALLERAERAAERLERAAPDAGLESLRDHQSIGAASRDRATHERGAATTSDPVSREIYSLADEGLPPVEIARRLEEHVGKVELILALRGG